MFNIQRVAGDAPGRSWGTAYHGLAWAVAVSPDSRMDMYGQTQRTLTELDRVLAELGAEKTSLLSATVYVSQIEEKEDMDRAWCEWIGDDPRHWPQRACVEAGLAGDTRVEIVVVAACPSAQPR